MKTSSIEVIFLPFALAIAPLLAVGAEVHLSGQEVNAPIRFVGILTDNVLPIVDGALPAVADGQL